MRKLILIFSVISFVSNYVFTEVLHYYFPDTGLGGIIILPTMILVSLVQSLIFGVSVKYFKINLWFLGITLLLLGYLIILCNFPQDVGHSAMNKIWNKL